MEVTVIVSFINLTALYTTHSTFTTCENLSSYCEMDCPHENLWVMHISLSFFVQNVWDTVQYYNCIEVTIFELGPAIQETPKSPTSYRFQNKIMLSISMIQLHVLYFILFFCFWFENDVCYFNKVLGL